MKLDDAMREWQASELPGDRPIDDALIARVRTDALALDEQVRRRDRREILAALIVSLFFLLPLFTGSAVTRLGALLAVAGCALIVVMLRRARVRHPAGRPDQSLAAFIDAERARLDAQVRLLESVLWWYVVPLALGAVLIVVGGMGITWASLVYGLVVILTGAFIVRLNQASARGPLAAQRGELERLRAQLGE
jgi:hypothetical protein